ncbi:hypothetical protein OG250_01410 [Streptomyces sp. NBC_00487]|nr:MULTISPECIES: hypothetical protein [unclassified Streptomyces]
MSDAVHIVLDDTAMAAADQGNVLASRLIHRRTARHRDALPKPG